MSSTNKSNMRSQTMDASDSETALPFLAFSKRALAGSAILPGVKLLIVMPSICTGKSSVKLVFLTINFHLKTLQLSEIVETTTESKRIVLFAVEAVSTSFIGFENHIIKINI